MMSDGMAAIGFGARSFAFPQPRVVSMIGCVTSSARGALREVRRGQSVAVFIKET
jgi:hypothetical protein